MKGVFALAALALLAGCANLNMFNKAEPQQDKWTTWTCDSQAQVVWRFTDQAHSQVDIRLGGSDRVYRLKQDVAASGVLYSNDQLAFHTKGEEGLVYWVATDDLIGRGCKAP
ncbi:lysozyme inhibitor [Pseudomonas sp. ANT_H14]|uniref:MliC family protein n=1 Tax=unclassified Pseudomonas TaxID=196821 RepID=UPI0011EE0C23|nr:MULTISPECIES: MliC family protein [unclassified Pseudomonas]KAA0949365.1 lysozyme inhibitor [Pseudomonas sp. ANT_H14]KAA0950264.1 lysozyme inhibitor [Pseudomonas sp. ANT_H4]